MPLRRVRRTARGRRSAPAVKPGGGQVWIISRHADVKALLSDPRMSIEASNSRHGYQGFGLPPALDAHLMNVDNQAHTRLRRLVASAFTPRRIDAQRDRIQAAADRQQVWPLLRYHVLATPFQIRQILVRKQDMGYKPDTGMKPI